jgi:precorrin-4 methylase
MTVSFIGAGPGAPDLITLRGLERIKTAELTVDEAKLRIEQEETAFNLNQMRQLNLGD